MTIVENLSHVLDILRHPDRVYPFDAPSKPNRWPTRPDEAGLQAIRAEIATLLPAVSPTSYADPVHGPTAEEIMEATYKAGLKDFAVNPTRLADIDREGAAAIQRRCTNTVLAESMVNKQGHSSRKIVIYIKSKGALRSTKAGKSSLKLFTERAEEGLDNPTEITSQGGVVELKQTAYIEKLAATWFPDGVPSTMQSNKVPADVLLPQLVADALVLADERETSAIRAYQSLVGALLYASTNTRPDITYAVGMLCRAMVKPTPELHDAALRVLGYLVRTKHLGLRYQADKLAAVGFSDSDWGVKHSTSGFVFMYNSAAINWGSKKQVSVALSSCEAEIMAASLAASEAVHLRGFLQELGLAGEEPLEVGVDNTGARDIAYNPEHHQKVKHIQRRHFFI